MFIKLASKGSRAWTLVEAMVAVSIFSIGGLALATMFLFSTRSFTAMANYALLDQYNRQAMDKFTSELRQAKQVTGYSSNATACSITFLSGDSSGSVTYTFDSRKRRVVRSDNNGAKTMLTNCDLLYFTLGMRPPPPPSNSTFDLYPAAIGNGTNWQQSVKVVQLTWRTAMTISPTAQVNSEDIQTASVVIRKQQDN